MKLRYAYATGFALFAVVTAQLYGFNPPSGGDESGDLLSASLMGGSSSVAGGAFGSDLPGELAANPALAAGEQRITLDASYAALIGAGDDSGVGHAVNLGGVYPTRAANFAGSINFLTAPFDSLALGTSGTLRASLSKDLTDKLYVGAGLAGSVGTGWGVAGDLGLLYKAGDMAGLRDVRMGVALTGIGRTFTPDTDGVKGGAATGFPSMFTPKTGLAATLFSAKDVKVGASADLSAPSFQNLEFDAGVDMRIKELVTIKSAWNFNLLETLESSQTYIPSISVGVNLKLNPKNKDSFLARNGWANSDITPTAAFKPFYKDIYAVGTGVNVKLGVVDTEPPEITVDYPEPIYISPNSDGIQDALEFGLSIKDRRYVVSWAFVIKNSDGAVVRTIANKESRPEMQNIKSAWTLLTKVKEGIAVPESLRWDGTLDSGEIAPDGDYTFFVEATDDNGNHATTGDYVVHVDATAPTVTVAPPTGANAMIFSPDGDGNKDTFTIAQTGSIEDLWTAVVTNSAGQTVRTIKTTSASPANFVWDGKADANVIVPDGVYAYSIAAKDRAGNSAAAGVTNIIVDTDKPAVNISIDLAAFSPNGDGVKDAVTLTPSVPVLSGLVGWDIAIVGRNGATARAFTGASGAPKAIAFDGTDASGNRIAEGDYQAVISARYVNGYAPVARSPFFTLDVTPPEASARSSVPIFSPVGDGKLDTVTFTQTTSSELSWTAQVFTEASANIPAAKPIKTVQLGATPPETFTWDGRDDSGRLAPDGNYAYVLSSTDRAGNTGKSAPAAVELNTEKADLILQQNLSAFSPNGDGVKETIVFTPIVKAATAVSKYSLTIKNAAGAVVKTMEGTGKVPAGFSWNGVADPIDGAATGERCPDGMYGAALEVTLANMQVSRSQAPDFTIDTKYPSVEISAPYLTFSPNGDGSRDALPLTQRSSSETLWSASILNAKNVAVKTLSWNGEAQNFAWDATDESGNPVPDGTYSYSISSEDGAGNKTSQRLSGIVVDARVPKAYLTAALPAFSPNGDGIKDAQQFSVVTNVPDGLASWTLAIKPTSGAAVKTWSSTANASAAQKPQALPATVNWDGTADSGAAVKGTFVAELTLDYEKGDHVVVSTPAFLVNPTPPALGVKLTPKYFSPDNDGNEDELNIELKAESLSSFAEWSFEIREPEGTSGGVFWKTGGTGKITDRLIWDGRSLKGELVQAATDYPFTFTVKDDVGMTSVVRGYVPVDVMVIRDGDKLKIAVPSIIFRENAADFNGLDPAVVEKNTQVLRRIAEILNKFRDYKIQVEGHANNVTGTQKEEDAELIPLSRARAEAVKNFLVANGVAADRLSTVGMGGTKPVVQRSDRENWWKNRRVEFVLIK